MKAAGSTAPSRLLVRAPNWLGDAVMALPAMAAVRRAFPAASVAIAAPASLAPMFQEETPAAQDELIVAGAPGAEAAALGAGRFDAVLLLPNSFRAAWIARQTGIPERWGFSGHLRGWLLTRAVRRPRGRVHQAEYYLALVRGLGIDPDRTETDPVRLKADATDTETDPVRLKAEATGIGAARITVRAETARRAGALLAREGIAPAARVVGFAPGAAYGHAKRWPPGRVAALIARVSAEHGAACVLVGAAGDREAGREIESALPPPARVVNLIGRTDLRLLAGVLARCGAFVSNDSGAMHLAAALGVPVVAIFGPTDERVTAPLGDAAVLVHPVFCRPCMLRDCPIDHRCMKGITVDGVFGVLSAHLAAPRQEQAGE